MGRLFLCDSYMNIEIEINDSILLNVFKMYDFCYARSKAKHFFFLFVNQRKHFNNKKIHMYHYETLYKTPG